MRAILFALLISLTLVASESLANERSTLMAEAMECCSSTCGTQEFTQLRHKHEIFGEKFGQDQSLGLFFERFFSGDICVHARKASKASFAGMTCPYGPYDVAAGDVLVNCTYDVYHSTGVYYGSINAYAVNGGGSVSYLGNTGYFYDSLASSPFWSGTVTLVLRQYSTSGNYTASLFAYAVNYTSYVTAQAVFGVKATLNDAAPPALTGLSIPPINLFDLSSAFAAFTATDDRSGVCSLSVSVYNSTTTVGYGYYSAPIVNGKQVGSTSVTASLQISFYYGVDIRAGQYSISVYVYDCLSKAKYLYAADLAALSLQVALIVDQSYCPAGKYLPYGQSGSCLVCPFGSFSSNFAFRCKACPAGTWPNATGSCSPCPAGSYGVGGSYYCTYCPAGTYSYSTGARICQPCSAGTYSAAGATSCTSCPSGTYSLPASTGSAGCTACPPGTASSYYYYGCQPCEAGYYAPLAGTSYCAACPAGSYSSAIGSTSCTSCPAGQSSIMSSNSPLNCA